MNCSYCGSNKHPTSYCPKTWQGQSKRMQLRCSYCGERNHNYEGCLKIRYFPADKSVIILDLKS